jgi:hypothetical protein
VGSSCSSVEVHVHVKGPHSDDLKKVGLHHTDAETLGYEENFTVSFAPVKVFWATVTLFRSSTSPFTGFKVKINKSGKDAYLLK